MIKKCIIFLTICLTSCTSIVEFKNDDQHLIESKSVVDSVFYALNNRDFSLISRYIDTNLISTDKLKQFLKVGDSLRGKLKSYKYVTGNSLVKFKDEVCTYYLVELEYLVNYEKHEATEMFKLTRNNSDNSPKVSFYNTKIIFD